MGDIPIEKTLITQPEPQLYPPPPTKIDTKSSDTKLIDCPKTGETSLVEVDIEDDISSTKSALEGSKTELEQVLQNQSYLKTDLDIQQQSYDTALSEKGIALADFKVQIQAEETNLGNANSNLTTAKGELLSAQSEAQSASLTMLASQNLADTEFLNLESANVQLQGALDTKNGAEALNTEAISLEASARSEYSSAELALNTAMQNTQGAITLQSAAEQALQSEALKTQAANQEFLQEQANVEHAQAEYNNAAGNENLWEKFKGAISNLFSTLQNAIMGRDRAKAELERQQKEEEKARAVNEEAIVALNARHKEQEQAQNVADSAMVILQEKAGNLEITEKNYAEALLNLTEAATFKDNAENSYNNALEQFLSDKEYKIDADRKVTDSEGKMVEYSQLCAELEICIQNLNTDMINKETAYGAVLESSIQAIKADEANLQELDKEIAALNQAIEQNENKLALQEQMLSELQAKKAAQNAERQSAGIWDDLSGTAASIWGGGYKKQDTEIKEKQALLEQAIISGSDEDNINAYLALNGDKEIYFLNGNIVSLSEISPDDKDKLIAKPLSSLNQEQIAQAFEKEGQMARSAIETAKLLSEGAFSYNGQTISGQEVAEAILKQAESLQTEMLNAREHQGWLSRGISALNDTLGFGTSASNMQSQVNSCCKLAQELANCKNPEEFAAKYKAITGNNFSVDTIAKALCYSEMTGIAPEYTDTPKENDFSQYVSALLMTAKENGATPDDFSEFGNTKAKESIQSYLNTQKTMTDAAIGLMDGVLTAVAVGLTPFTGGASIAAAGVLGGIINIGINSSNSIYDIDGDGTKDFNYTAGKALEDFALGGIYGAAGIGANKVGTKVAASVAERFGAQAAATTFKEAVSYHALNIGSKLARGAVEGLINGGFGSAGMYLFDVLRGKENFSLKELGQKTLTGAGTGAVISVGMTGITAVGGEIIGSVKADKLSGEINGILNGAESDNPLAKMIADKLDDSLLVNGKINGYATQQLMDNANNVLSALKRAGITGQTAMDVLNRSSLEQQFTLAGQIDDIQNQLSKLVKQGKLSSDDAKAILSGIDTGSIQLDSKGNVQGFKFMAENSEFTLKMQDGKAMIETPSVAAEVDNTVKAPEITRINIPDEMRTKLDNVGVIDIDNYTPEQCQTMEKLADMGFSCDMVIDYRNGSEADIKAIQELISYMQGKGLDIYSIENIICESGKIPTIAECARPMRLISLGVQGSNLYAFNDCSDEVYQNAEALLSQIGKIKGFNEADIFSCMKRRDFSAIAERMAQFGTLDDDDIKILSGLITNKRGIGATSDLSSRFGKFNYIVNGETLDVDLHKRVYEMGRKYGCTIKLDNDAISESYRGATASSKTISDSYIETVEETLKFMQQNGLETPKDIYLSNFLKIKGDSNSFGEFGYKNPNQVVISTDIPDTKRLVEVILHETTHMSDFNLGSGKNFLTDETVAAMGLDSRGALSTLNKGNRTLQPEDVSNIISEYATTNYLEFVAEVGALVKSGAITKQGLFKTHWGINPEIATSNYFKGWTGSKEQKQALDMIMALYTQLTTP